MQEIDNRPTSLGWRVYIAKLTQKIFLSYEVSLEISSDFAEIVKPLLGGSEKSFKIPAKFPVRFSPAISGCKPRKIRR